MSSQRPARPVTETQYKIITPLLDDQQQRVQRAREHYYLHVVCVSYVKQGLSLVNDSRSIRLA